MSSTQSRRAATFVGTERLVGSYVPNRSAKSDAYADVAAVVLFSVIGLAISLVVALSASVPATEVMLAAFMS